MSHLWMQSATWSHTCAVSSVEGTRYFFRAHFRRTSEVVMHAWGCVILFWTGNVCFWNGSDYTRPHLCVTVILRAHVLVIVRVVGDSVSELSPLSVSAQHSKVHNPISPLLLSAILKACFRWYPFSISPLFLSSSSSFAFLTISCFLSSSTSLSHS